STRSLNRLPQTFSGPGKRRPGRPGIPAVMDSRRRKKSFTGYSTFLRNLQNDFYNVSIQYYKSINLWD
ncbi:MAG: hypothetical protein AB7D24_04825, partial [Sphaerochaeta sp.]|uniref:hypothetical protein n=1 Tax=Sphaerochaeta sp. TaxID=1972642 RepID=UPI003D0CD2BF